MNEDEIPASLKESYNEARESEQYLGTLDEWTKVQYLLFRLAVQHTGREPASYRRWMRNLKLVDE